MSDKTINLNIGLDNLNDMVLEHVNSWVADWNVTQDKPIKPIVSKQTIQEELIVNDFHLLQTADSTDGSPGSERSTKQESIRPSDELMYKVIGNSTQSDGKTTSDVNDTAYAKDDISYRVSHVIFVGDLIKAGDGEDRALSLAFDEKIAAGDSVSSGFGFGMSSNAVLRDEVLFARSDKIGVSDYLSISDGLNVYFLVSVSDSVSASDTAAFVTNTVYFLSDSVGVLDNIGGKNGAIKQIDGHELSDTIDAGDVFNSRFDALFIVDDRLVVDDIFRFRLVGANDDRFLSFAWTANTDNWAMSRYGLGGIYDIAVIDGVLHAFADDGIYALDGVDEDIYAELATGKVDLGGGMLVHPVAAYMEYSLSESGVADMEVSTTQSGEKKAYSYRLIDGKAVELTNGRFIFGRGLRGRHFGFALKLSAKSAHIHDLRVDISGTKRRV